MGSHGGKHDARIFSNLEVFTIGQSGMLAPNTVPIIGGVSFCHLGGSSVPPAAKANEALSWVGLSVKEEKFNSKLNRAHVVIEYAFGRFKGRWHPLLKRNDVKIELMITFVTACCILDNICEVHQDSFDDQRLG